jgi:hypothetical protein
MTKSTALSTTFSRPLLQSFSLLLSRHRDKTMPRLPKKRPQYTGKRWGRDGKYASKQEMRIGEAYPTLQYQPPTRIHYTQSYVYLPDWRLGVDPDTGLAVYLEAKEIFTLDMESKYVAVVDSNPRMFLVIITPNILTRVLDRLNAHPRIEVVVSHYEIPEKWLKLE